MGNLYFSSGLTGVRPEARKDPLAFGGDIKEQTKRILDLHKANLESMGSSLENVLKVTVFLADVKTSVAEAARVMKDADVGSLIVLEGEAVRGMVTDRDIVIRVVAEGRDAGATALGEICSQEPIMVSLRDTVEAAVEMMQTHAVRRLPVVDDDGRAVGIVSLGDLAVELDRGSALGDISAAPPKR